MSATDIEQPKPPSGNDYLQVQASPEFAELRSRLRRFVFPTTVFFLIWYATYVLLGAFSHDFMATRVWGNINAQFRLRVVPAVQPGHRVDPAGVPTGHHRHGDFP